VTPEAVTPEANAPIELPADEAGGEGMISEAGSLAALAAQDSAHTGDGPAAIELDLGGDPGEALELSNSASDFIHMAADANVGVNTPSDDEAAAAPPAPEGIELDLGGESEDAMSLTSSAADFLEMAAAANAPPAPEPEPAPPPAEAAAEDPLELTSSAADFLAMAAQANSEEAEALSAEPSGLELDIDLDAGSGEDAPAPEPAVISPPAPPAGPAIAPPPPPPPGPAVMTPPAPAQQGAPSSGKLLGEYRVVVQLTEGESKRGRLIDPDLEGESFSLLPQAGTGVPANLPRSMVRAIFFPDVPGEEPIPLEIKGPKVRVRFPDGHQLEGHAAAVPAPGGGFFLVPDPNRTKGISRVYVYPGKVQIARI